MKRTGFAVVLVALSLWVGRSGQSGESSCEPGSVVIPYLGSEYKYRVVANGALAGFEQPGFDDSAFDFASAAFGGLDGGNDHSCAIMATARTVWPLGTDILVRKSFELPAGVERVSVGVAVDNDVQVFINGIDISGGLQLHGGCATRDSFVFTANRSVLEMGSNVVAARARDRGGVSYFDLQLLVDSCQPRPGLEVDLLRQCADPWGPHPFAVGPDRPNGIGTFCRWACAVTSCAMVINYHAEQQGSSFRTDPQQLNDWLVANGGYTCGGVMDDSAGNLLWEAVPVYVSEQEEDLRFYWKRRYWSERDDVVDAALAQGDPAILEVTWPGTNGQHFVVAIGRERCDGQDTYAIQDPQDPSGNDMQFYNCRYSGIRLYSATPPENQSRFTARVCSPVELLVRSPAGKETGVDLLTGEVIETIPESSYAVEALAADDGSGEVLEPTKVVEVQHPSPGAYVLELLGTAVGTYTLICTVVDPLGTPSELVIDGTTSAGGVQIYEASVDPSVVGPPTVTLVESMHSRFRRGDGNGDGTLDVSDAINSLGWLFLGGPAPPCADSADANDDGTIDISDAVSTLGFLFLGEIPPPAPGPAACGEDPSADELPPCGYNQLRC